MQRSAYTTWCSAVFCLRVSDKDDVLVAFLANLRQVRQESASADFRIRTCPPNREDAHMAPAPLMSETARQGYSPINDSGVPRMCT
jgi:hypothetical protein